MYIYAEGSGRVTSELMEEYLTTKGTAFRGKELENFFMVSKDPESGNIYYEDYIALLQKSHAGGNKTIHK